MTSKSIDQYSNDAPRLLAVLGHPIKHSASPAMQNAGIAALGLHWHYQALDVPPEKLRAALADAKAKNFIGLNLTVPHKLLAVEMMDELDASAQTWGAVNTIRFETDATGKVHSRGFNTDADAIVKSLREEFEWPEDKLRGAAVLLIGAGGAARATALRLSREGISSLFLINRTEENAVRLASEIRNDCPNLKIEIAPTRLVERYPHDPVDLVINATSLGLSPDDALPIDEAWLRSRHPQRVYDMIYRPAETPLLRAAKAAGCRTANGLGMLLYQGAAALEIWSGQPAPIAIMRRALEENIYSGAVGII